MYNIKTTGLTECCCNKSIFAETMEILCKLFKNAINHYHDTGCHLKLTLLTV